MAEQRYVEHARAGAVDTVTIRRLEVHNAFNEHVIAQLAEAFAAISASADTRVVVLRGEGRSFSAGADLDWMRRAANFTDAENRRDADALASMLCAVAECPCPVVARVQGNAMGGGAGLAAAADIAIAGESARFAFSEVRLGLVPATIARHVVRKVGAGRALPLFLTGERIDAARALAIGLVHRIAPDDQLDAAVAETVDALLAGSPAAQRRVKELVRRVAPDDAAIDDFAAGMISSIRGTDEGREGVAAFLEKRQPGWTPRADV
ncbi:MAG: enoyl-CoA hydratase/isomerase family protein [Dehalococcoidia bacterium]|nr:MAG: enoyl-CoA hydratase/isomerase family protein [Dehalococcoidia bacterium]